YRHANRELDDDSAPLIRDHAPEPCFSSDLFRYHRFWFPLAAIRTLRRRHLFDEPGALDRDGRDAGIGAAVVDDPRIAGELDGVADDLGAARGRGAVVAVVLYLLILEVDGAVQDLRR